MGEPRNQFTFYRSYYDAIVELSKRDQSAIILAVCAYAIYETEPTGLSAAAMTAFKLIRPTLDTGRKKAEIGRAGGSKQKANGKQDESKPKANPKRGEVAREKEVEVEKEKEIEIEKEVEVEVDVDVEGESSAEAAAAAANTERIKALGGTLGHGVVFLSDAQMNDLLDRMGIDAFDYYVDKLANFIIQKDARVKNHYETILKWWREDGQIGGGSG